MKTITQKVVFKNTTVNKIYDLYMDASLHALTTGGPVTISKVAGSEFSAHGNYITDKTIHLMPDQLIVQTWRAMSWSTDDPDSVFTITLEQKGKNVVLYAAHANVPDNAVESLKKGWNEHYWDRWKEYLEGKPISMPKM